MRTVLFLLDAPASGSSHILALVAKHFISMSFISSLRIDSAKTPFDTGSGGGAGWYNVFHENNNRTVGKS